jgi:hypothetical protein
MVNIVHSIGCKREYKDGARIKPMQETFLSEDYDN